MDSRDSKPKLRRNLQEEFERNGHVIVPNLVDLTRIATLRDAHDRCLDRWSVECETSREEYERVVSQWTNVHQQDDAFAVQLHHPDVAAVAKQLLGVEDIQLFHDHLISKPPAVSSTIPWHQDYPFWPVDKPHAVSCWLALDDADTESGAMYFMPGAHQEGEQPPVDFLRAPHDWGARADAAVPTQVDAGDCIFHSCLSWHTSPPNTSTRPRRAFITIFMSTDCRWAPDHSDWHPMNDCVTVQPGERFNTDRFPIIGNAGASC